MLPPPPPFSSIKIAFVPVKSLFIFFAFQCCVFILIMSYNSIHHHLFYMLIYQEVNVCNESDFENFRAQKQVLKDSCIINLIRLPLNLRRGWSSVFFLFGDANDNESRIWSKDKNLNWSQGVLFKKCGYENPINKPEEWRWKKHWSYQQDGRKSREIPCLQPYSSTLRGGFDRGEREQ